MKVFRRGRRELQEEYIVSKSSDLIRHLPPVLHELLSTGNTFPCPQQLSLFQGFTRPLQMRKIRCVK
jgi:hypothetical protein